MREGVECEPALPASGVVAELGGGPCMAEFMHGDADDERDGEGGESDECADGVNLKLVEKTE